MPGVSPAGVAANGTVARFWPTPFFLRGLGFCGWSIPNLPSCSPWLRRVWLHGFMATMGTLTAAGPLQPTCRYHLFRSLRRAIRRRGAGPLGKQCPALLVITTCRPRPLPGSSPCLSCLTFRPFRLQPPPCHPTAVALTRYFTAAACRVYPPARPFQTEGFAVARSRVHPLRAVSPTGLAESSSLALRTGRSSQVALHPSSGKRSYHF